MGLYIHAVIIKQAYILFLHLILNPEEIFVPKWGSMHVHIPAIQMEFERAQCPILEQNFFRTVQFPNFPGKFLWMGAVPPM